MERLPEDVAEHMHAIYTSDTEKWGNFCILLKSIPVNEHAAFVQEYVTYDKESHQSEMREKITAQVAAAEAALAEKAEELSGRDLIVKLKLQADRALLETMARRFSLERTVCKLTSDARQTAETKRAADMMHTGEMHTVHTQKKTHGLHGWCNGEVTIDKKNKREGFIEGDLNIALKESVLTSQLTDEQCVALQNKALVLVASGQVIDAVLTLENIEAQYLKSKVDAKKLETLRTQILNLRQQPRLLQQLEGEMKQYSNKDTAVDETKEADNCKASPPQTSMLTAAQTPGLKKRNTFKKHAKKDRGVAAVGIYGALEVSFTKAAQSRLLAILRDIGARWVDEPDTLKAIRLFLMKTAVDQMTIRISLLQVYCAQLHIRANDANQTYQHVCKLLNSVKTNAAAVDAEISASWRKKWLRFQSRYR